MMRLALLSWCLAAPCWAQNVQPISHSLTDCAVLLSEFADRLDRRPFRRADKTSPDEIRAWSDDFLEEAVHQAEREGLPDGEAHVIALMDEVTPRWRKDVNRLVPTRETLDWFSYCRALGLDRRIID